MKSLQLSRVVLYVRDIPKVADFYQRYFGFSPVAEPEEGWLELGPQQGGCCIALHQASAAQKRGSEIKLVFAVEDVYRAKASFEAAGLKFGVVHELEEFEFCNAKDPAGNSISISSRGVKRRVQRAPSAGADKPSR
jgi:catechol 2,3-dioxygenase-like lactoylglutathione lyase family enzyme